MTEHFLDSVNKSDSKTSWPTGIDIAIAIANNAPTRFGIGMKHFSSFIRPGYVRYGASSLPRVARRPP